MKKSNETPVTLNPAPEKIESEVKSLDDLLEVLDQDDLRHVVGGSRPKTIIAAE